LADRWTKRKILVARNLRKSSLLWDWDSWWMSVNPHLAHCFLCAAPGIAFAYEMPAISALVPEL